MLKPLLKPYRKHIFFAPLLKLCEAVLELITPLMVAAVIDKGILGGNGTAVLKYGGIMLLLAGGGFLFALLCQYLASLAGQGFGTDLRNALTKNYLNMPLGETDGLSPAAWNARVISDTHNLQHALAMALRLLSRSPFLLIGATAAAFVLDYRLAFVFVGTAFCLAGSLFFIIYKSKRHFSVAASATDSLIDNIRENLRGARVVRAANRVSDELERAEKNIKAAQTAHLLANKFSSALNPATFLIVNLAVLALVALGRGRMAESGFEVGKLVALTNYMIQILQSLLVLASLTVIFMRSFAGAKRISPLLKPKAAPLSPAETKKEECDWLLEFRNVCFRYKGQTKNTLTNLNFTLKKSERLGILGGTASGKSTVAHLIGGLYQPTEGVILWKGQDMRSLPPALLRQEISVMPQTSALVEGLSLRENLTWREQSAKDDDLFSVLQTAQAKAFVLEKPDGLDTVIPAGGRNFSYGQKQRLALARALLGNPLLLVLDDSLTALDAQTYNNVARNLSKRQGAQILLSQRESEVAACDTVVCLDTGGDSL